MNIGVIGHNGRLGYELCSTYSECYPIECDISKDNLYITGNPDVIINCAAYTNVDGAETKEGRNRALAVNFRGVEHIRRAWNGRLIHISTDYVFNGKRGPYKEQTRPIPVNSYGFSKYGGEVVFLNPYKSGDTIVRTTGLYGGKLGKHDFVRLVVDTLIEGKELEVTSDLRGNQTYVPHLAEALMNLCYVSNPPTILHIGSKEVVSRYEFALMIATVFSLDKSLLKPVKSTEIPGWVAPRPKKGGLKTNLAKKLGIPIYSIKDGLEDFMVHYELPISETRLDK